MGSFVGAQLLKSGEAGVFGGWMMGMVIFGLCGIFVVVVWPREKSNVDEPREEITAKSVLLRFRPPKNAPDFYYALAGRTMMMGGYWMINTYQLFIAQDYVFAGDPDAKLKAASVIANMAVITLVVSLIAAVTAGPLTDRIGMRKVPVALASCLFAVGALMPLLFRSEMGMYLFAGIAGLGYGTYNAIDQALNVSVLPNPDEAGKDLGILNLANTLSTVIGSVMTSVIVVIVKSVMGVTKTPPEAYSVVFIVAIVIVLIASWLIMRIKHVK
ncbi:transporter [Bifidobacterium sp. UTCIF-37]|nr:transporter [Bifidobacterium sp. UTCIF-37]TPF87293.1 transporter [Bifidobacterium sp. UTCIF-38]